MGELAHTGRSSFLQYLGGIVCEFNAEEAAPFLRLLDKWGKWDVYSESALDQMRQMWTPRGLKALRGPDHIGQGRSSAARTSEYARTSQSRRRITRSRSRGRDSSLTPSL